MVLEQFHFQQQWLEILQEEHFLVYKLCFSLIRYTEEVLRSVNKLSDALCPQYRAVL